MRHHNSCFSMLQHKNFILFEEKMNNKLLIFNVICIVFAAVSTFEVQASAMNCLIEKDYVFTSSSEPFERGEINKKEPSLTKGYVGKMFTVDLENGQVNDVSADMNIIKRGEDIIYQLIDSGSASEVITLLNLVDNVFEPDSKMSFTYTIGLEVASGYCQK